MPCTFVAISYYLELLLAVAPFSKRPLSITLHGVTNSDQDISIDTFRNVTLSVMERFGVRSDDGGSVPQIVLKKRGAPPLGGGEVLFSCPIVRQLSPIQFLDEGMIKRIRGLAYTTRLDPTHGIRMVTSARALLNRFIPDVYIFTDHYKGASAGSSSGFATILQAESDTGVRITAEYCGRGNITPEEVGRRASILLIEEIKKGGCIDSSHQWLYFLYMTLTPEDVSKVRVGKLSEYGIEYLRHIRDFFGVTFKIVPEFDTNTVVISCLGSGFKNLARKTA